MWRKTDHTFFLKKKCETYAKKEKIKNSHTFYEEGIMNNKIYQKWFVNFHNALQLSRVANQDIT